MMRFSFLLILSALAWADSSDTKYRAVLKDASDLTENRKFDEAANLLRKALANASEDHAGRWVPYLLNDLGSTYAQHGMYREAERSYLRSIAYSASPAGGNKAPLASTLSNLGSLYFEAGQFAKAEKYMLRALDQVKGSVRDSTAIVENNLGALYLAQHKIERAMESAQASLEIWLRLSGEDSDGTAFSRTVLGSAYHHLRELPEAKDNLEKALVTWQRLHGPRDVRTAKGMANLGYICIDTGDLNRAAELFQGAYDVFERIGQSDQFVLDFLKSYSEVERKLGRKKEAKQLVLESRRMESASAANIIAAGVIDVSAFRSNR
jgi:tetratricopeptide (TPR) repeat protein